MWFLIAYLACTPGDLECWHGPVLVIKQEYTKSGCESYRRKLHEHAKTLARCVHLNNRKD